MTSFAGAGAPRGRAGGAIRRSGHAPRRARPAGLPRAILALRHVSHGPRPLRAGTGPEPARPRCGGRPRRPRTGVFAELRALRTRGWSRAGTGRVRSLPPGSAPEGYRRDEHGPLGGGSRALPRSPAGRVRGGSARTDQSRRRHAEGLAARGPRGSVAHGRHGIARRWASRCRSRPGSASGPRSCGPRASREDISRARRWRASGTASRRAAFTGRGHGRSSCSRGSPPDEAGRRRDPNDVERGPRWRRHRGAVELVHERRPEVVGDEARPLISAGDTPRPAPGHRARRLASPVRGP